MIVNSKEWWDDGFLNWWEKTEGINGPDQTRYFMDLIIKYAGINFAGLSALDFGCAMGQGVDALTLSTGISAEGYDISSTGIEKAQKLYPDHRFYHTKPDKVYDLVVCSNVLEHFADPIPLFMDVLKLSRKYAIILTPFNQTPTCEVHPLTVTEATFPARIHGFKLTRTVQVPNEKPELGGGNQILFVYERMDNGYFSKADEYSNTLRGWTIPGVWWSRLYEYVWAQRYIETGQTNVDAGCGSGYVFKYRLADAGPTIAVDIDPNLARDAPRDNLQLVVADIANTGLPDGCADKVFCISVLEHLGREKAEGALKEFHRILKPGGKAVITMDIAAVGPYSWVTNPQDFFSLVPRGLSYSEVEQQAPENAIFDPVHNLYCYHAILTKER